MSTGITVLAAVAGDAIEWQTLWDGYCFELNASVP